MSPKHPPLVSDHVLLTFANLYRIFDGLGPEDEGAASAVKESLEKRWAKTDQDAFILCTFFNPYIRDRLFGEHVSLTRAGLFGTLLGQVVSQLCHHSQTDF